MKILHSLDIRSSPETVWYWLGDPEHAKTWMTSVTHTETLKQTEGWVGTTFRETVADEGGSTDMTGIVTAYVPNKHLAMHLEGQYNRVDVCYELEDLGNSTRLTSISDVRFRSFLMIMMFFLGPAFKKKIKQQLVEEFNKLKMLCERNNPDSDKV
jgi:hypothetical protein